MKTHIERNNRTGRYYNPDKPTKPGSFRRSPRYRHQKHCLQCGTAFTSARSTAKYCCTSCRTLAHRDKYQRAETFSEPAQQTFAIIKRHFPDAATFIDHVRVTQGIKEGYTALKVIYEATKTAYDRGLTHRGK